MAPFFSDPDDDELIFTAESARTAQVTATVSADTVWLSAHEAGEANVAVTACDPDGLCASQTMQVTVEAASTASQSDREALEAFYDATGGDAWEDNTNWKTAAALDSWYGVTTGRSDRVTRLELRRNGLTGAVPVALRSLDELEVLQLGGNSLAGPVPSWLGSLSNLQELWLWGNELTGPVPAELGSLTDLRGLDLCCNELTGSIPAALRNLGDLEALSLSWNNLTGPIPDWVSSLDNLVEPLAQWKPTDGSDSDGPGRPVRPAVVGARSQRADARADSCRVGRPDPTSVAVSRRSQPDRPNPNRGWAT